MTAESQKDRPAKTTLVLGGTRSGKSAYAESLVSPSPQPVYLATAEARDNEMQARISIHQERRGGNWKTVEEPLELVETIRRHDSIESHILVDCLTLWLSNLMAAGRDIEIERDRLCALLPTLSAPVVIVSNEVGQGIVPMDPLSRRFRDEAGFLNQSVAASVDRVVLVTAGLPLDLK